jgi:FkbM family methyltransferase
VIESRPKNVIRGVMMSAMQERRRRLGLRLQSLGRAIEQPGRLQRKVTGVHIDEDVAQLASRPYLRAHALRTVLDVGANEGQFARTALLAFPAARIICFEPLPSLQAILGRLAADSLGRVVVESCALGDRDGTIEFHVSSFSPSSSVLPLDRPDPVLAAQIRQASTVNVPIQRLRDWASSRSNERPLLIKLDVQGYEANVLRGAGDFLTQADVVIAETTFAPIYQGQATLGELCAILEPHGLRYREAFGVIRDAGTAEPLWQDSVFVRT